MKYYKDENNQIYAYEDYVIKIKDELMAVTKDEADEILAELNNPTKDQLITRNESKVKLLIDEASLKIDILQDAIDLDMAESGDTDKLKSWKKYRVLLSRVDTNVEEMKLPEKPE